MRQNPATTLAERLIVLFTFTFKDIKTFISSWTIQKQVVGKIWPYGWICWPNLHFICLSKPSSNSTCCVKCIWHASSKILLSLRTIWFYNLLSMHFYIYECIYQAVMLEKKNRNFKIRQNDVQILISQFTVEWHCESYRFSENTTEWKYIKIRLY